MSVRFDDWILDVELEEVYEKPTPKQRELWEKHYVDTENNGRLENYFDMVVEYIKNDMIYLEDREKYEKLKNKNNKKEVV